MAFDNARGGDRLGKLLRYAMLFLSAVLIVTGLIGRGRGDGELAVEVRATKAPSIDLSVYDETPETRETTLRGVCWYAIQLGAFESEDSAKALAKEYQARGAAGYVYRDARWRVLAAMYAGKDDVAVVREQLKERHSLDTFTHEIALDEVTLRLSGAKGQLDVLEESCKALDRLIGEMAEYSQQIDRQELTQSELLSALSQARSDLGALGTQLALRFSVPRHASVEGLIAAFQGFEDFYVTMEKTEQPSLVALAAMAKHEGFRLLDALRGVYEGF